ncbi:MAG: methylmalonyl Co-A mutase-associated GTPase MeaB, partial [Planctomycetes bacterium]|nr:methylmalonyl Co-A mutase-associated GTPase MeaB [Planctomycetota bacterium]
VSRLLDGDRRALARGLSVVEAGGVDGSALQAQVYPKTGQALRIGITGAPGVGKSCLVDQLAQCFADRLGAVGVVAVDPSSAFSRGALLGDRVRMNRSALDDRIFVRSMASRGELGGLSKATAAAADLMDAAGKKIVILETVGVGQSEIEVTWATDFVVIVLAPGAGDGIQALKAGLMEVGDLFCVNKCDLDGAERVRDDVEAALELSARHHDDPPPVLLVAAVEGRGLPELAEAILKALDERRADQRFAARRRQVAEHRIEQAVLREGQRRARARIAARPDLVAAVVDRRQDPDAVVQELLGEWT